jgi:hypothetical protein
MSDVAQVSKGANTVNGQYRFASHDAVVAKLHKPLVKHGIVVIPTVDSFTQAGNRTEVKLKVGFVAIDQPSDCFVVDYFGYGIDNGDKGPGKAISYALKYCLLKVFGLETSDDSDNDANSVYEAVKCLEFDLYLPADFTDKDKKQLAKFLAECASSMGKDVEDVKREALKRMPEFLNAFKTSLTKKKD